MVFLSACGNEAYLESKLFEAWHDDVYFCWTEQPVQPNLWTLEQPQVYRFCYLFTSYEDFGKDDTFAEYVESCEGVIGLDSIHVSRHVKIILSDNWVFLEGADPDIVGGVFHVIEFGGDKRLASVRNSLIHGYPISEPFIAKCIDENDQQPLALYWTHCFDKDSVEYALNYAYYNCPEMIEWLCRTCHRPLVRSWLNMVHTDAAHPMVTTLHQEFCS